VGIKNEKPKSFSFFVRKKVMRKEKNMALDTNVGNILNQQINKEFYSAYLYLTFADFYEEQGLKGFANWYVIQSQEELAHARILRRYLLDNDWTPTMEAIAKPDLTFSKVVEPIKAAYEHEQFITASINECYAVAQKANDFRTMQLLDWYVKEQGEEEANAADLLKAVELFGGDPKNLYDLDRENAARVYVAPTMPM
jgi:ferritin dps family protein